MATELVIEETQGEKRRIVLRGRSMPQLDDGPPSFGAQMRGRVSYAPGSPTADAQLVGAVWMPTTISGRWDDKFFGEADAPIMTGFKALGSRIGSEIKGSNGKARRAIEIVEVMLTMLRGQSDLRFEWGPMVRFGVMMEFDASPFKEETWLWKCTFNWTGDTGIRPIIKKKPRIEARSLFQLLLALLEGARKAIQLLGAPARFYAAKIAAPMEALTNAITGCLEELTKVIANAITPQKVLGDLRANLTKIKLAGRDLLKALTGIADFGEPLSGRDSALAGVAVLEIKKSIIAMAAQMAEREYELSKLETPEVQAAVFSADGESLRDISARFYGTPASWMRLAVYNTLPCNPPSGTLVLIPASNA